MRGFLKGGGREAEDSEDWWRRDSRAWMCEIRSGVDQVV